MFKSKKRARKTIAPPRKPLWLISRGALFLASIFFAAFSVVFWGLGLAEENLLIAIFVSGGFAVSAIVTPSVAPKLAMVKSVTTGLGIVAVIAVFGVIDTIGVTFGFQGLDRMMTEPAYQAALKEYRDQRAPLEASLRKATEARDSVILVTTFPDGTPYGPQRMAEARVSFNEQRAAFQETITETEGKLAQIRQPVRETRLQGDLILLLAGALQIALVLGMIALEGARTAAHEKALADYEARLAQAAADKQAKAEEKERRAKAEQKRRDRIAKDAAAAAELARKSGGPKLAYESERD